LIEPIAPSVGLTGQLATALGWLNALPETLIQTRPFLCVYHALLLALSNQLEAAEARLQAAEPGIQEEMPAKQVRTVQGWVLALRGSSAGYAGDILRAVSLARRALEVVPETEVLPRVIATLAAAFAYQEQGDVTLASEREIAAADAFVRTSNMPFAAVSAITLLARLYVLRGRLRLAAATYEQVVQVVSRPEILQTIFRSLSYHFRQLPKRILGMCALSGHLLYCCPRCAIIAGFHVAPLEARRGDLREDPADAAIFESALEDDLLLYLTSDE
jgi:tetratricopeptide (TPR) repeat protein